jgi:hypothetical protein
MKSARGEPVARTGLAGHNGHRLDPRVGLYRIVIVVVFVAVRGRDLSSQAALALVSKGTARVATARA